MLYFTIKLIQHGGTGDTRNPTLDFTRVAHSHLCYSTKMGLVTRLELVLMLYRSIIIAFILHQNKIGGQDASRTHK